MYFNRSPIQELLYLDSHILVVNKPACLLTQPSPSGGINLEDRVKALIKKRFNKPGRVFLVPVHRLDFSVSGLVLFARNSKSLSRLQAQMRMRQIEKTYYARVEGHLKQEQGCLNHFLIHGNRRAIVSTQSGKKAILTYRLLKRLPRSSLLKITLYTGRYHQIRAQFSHVGHPICGDSKYGWTGASQTRRIDLHHAVLTLRHPVRGNTLSLKSFPGFFSQNQAECYEVRALLSSP